MATEIRTREIARSERARAVALLGQVLGDVDSIGARLSETIGLVRSFDGERNAPELAPLDDLAGQTARLERSVQSEIKRLAAAIPDEGKAT